MGKLTQVTLEKEENGWEVEASYRTEKSEGSWDTEEKKFVFVTLDEAIQQIKTVAELG